MAHKPGLVPLRPLSVGDILQATFTAVFRRPLLYFGLAAVVAAVGVILGALVVGLLYLIGELDEVSSWVGSVGAIVITLAMPPTLMVLNGIVAHPVTEDALGVPPTASGTWRFVRPVLVRLFGGTALLTFCYLLLLAPGIVVLAIGAGTVPVLPLAALAIAALLVPIAWFAVRSSVMLPALAVERLGVVAALGRSFALTRGMFWRFLAALIVLGLITAVVQQVLGGLAILLPATGAVGDAIGYLLTPVIALVTQPFIAVLHAVLYLDTRIRHEAYDVVLSEAAARLGGGYAAAPQFFSPGADGRGAPPPGPWMSP
ncbi:hypothetical protein GCM10009624_35310 [Gordonia sinesedis]